MNKLCVNIYFTDIVYDNGTLVALLIAEDMVDKSSFACTEITCKKCYGNAE